MNWSQSLTSASPTVRSSGLTWLPAPSVSANSPKQSLTTTARGGHARRYLGGERTVSTEPRIAIRRLNREDLDAVNALEPLFDHAVQPRAAAEFLRQEGHYLL